MHVEQVFFVENARSTKNWKVVLCQELKGRRFKFNQDVSLEIAMFDLGNNANHACLKVIILVEQATCPPFKCR
jgi:hypothetical protein